MYVVTISSRTYALIQQMSLLGLKDQAHPNGDSTYTIQLSIDTFERLQERKVPGETVDDVIYRTMQEALQLVQRTMQ